MTDWEQEAANWRAANLPPEFSCAAWTKMYPHVARWLAIEDTAQRHVQAVDTDTTELEAALNLTPVEAISIGRGTR